MLFVPALGVQVPTDVLTGTGDFEFTGDATRNQERHSPIPGGTSIGENGAMVPKTFGMRVFSGGQAMLLTSA